MSRGWRWCQGRRDRAFGGGNTTVGSVPDNHQGHPRYRSGFSLNDPPDLLIQRSDEGEWIKGRAGMLYRDLIPGRYGGRVVASHIRLTKGGEVADYVHYHKVAFQVIFCLAGAIKVVYEDQGEPFWLRPGDCVLQPPEIRHRVLEAEAGSEVIEVGCPAVHETWVDHEMQLPTSNHRPDRKFSGQKFVRHVAKDAAVQFLEENAGEFADMGIAEATGGLAGAYLFKFSRENAQTRGVLDENGRYHFLFVLDGRLMVESREGERVELGKQDSVLLPPACKLIFSDDEICTVFAVTLPFSPE